MLGCTYRTKDRRAQPTKQEVVISKLDKEGYSTDTLMLGLKEQEMRYKGVKITKRKDNRYMAKPYIDGKQYSIYGKTQIECYNNLKEFFKKKPEEINLCKKKVPTLYEWLEQWYNTYKVDKLKPKSLYQIKICINKHIKNNLVDRPLNKLTSLDIDIALTKIESSRMRKYTYDCYCEALRIAYKNRIIKEDISSMINPVHHTRVKGTALTKEQRVIFLDKVKEVKYGEIFLFQYYSGCRPQGPRNLKWTDIKEDKIFINETKSKNGQRYIPYFDKLRELLETIPRIEERVFPISETTIKVNFKELKSLCGFEFSQKSLRHTFATICAENGIADITIAKWLGHGSPTTTKQYYIDVLSEFEKEQTNKLNNIYT